MYLEKSIVQAAFEYSIRENVTLCGFLGDECVTMRHTPEIQARHQPYKSDTRTRSSGPFRCLQAMLAHISAA